MGSLLFALVGYNQALVDVSSSLRANAAAINSVEVKGVTDTMLN